MNARVYVCKYSQHSYNVVSACRFIRKSHCMELRYNRTNQAKSYRVLWKPSTALYGTRAIRNSELVQIISFAVRVIWRPRQNKL